jgi:hypothetical protein
MRSGSARNIKGLLLAGAFAAALVLALVVFFAPSLYEVQDKGRDVVPYGNSVVYKVRVLDTFTIYAPEDARPEADKLSIVGLVAAATMVFMTWLLLDALRASQRVRRFYMFAAAGLALLAADENFGLHETLGHNLQFLADVPGVTRPDDLIFSQYAIALAIFAWQFRDVVLAHPKAVRLFAVGTVFFAVAVIGDLVGSGVDELAEVVASFFLLAGLVSMTVATLRQELDLDRGPAARVDALPRSANGSKTGVAADLSAPARPTP